MAIPLIVPVLNRFDLFTDMMTSVDYDIRPYIIDNSQYNRGVSKAWNLGMVRAKRDGFNYAIISNDDVKFKPDTIKKLYEEILKNEHVIIGADQHLDREECGLIKEERPEDIFRSVFCCFAININKLILKCGYFDEKFYPAYYEDNDMRYRARMAGQSIRIHTEAKIIHHKSSSNSNPEKPSLSNEQFQANEKYFIKKWGGYPQEETFTTPFGNPNLTIKDW
jgi:GT2 family glycosyltransferase